jgi:hypothetical protein
LPWWLTGSSGSQALFRAAYLPPGRHDFQCNDESV